MSWNLSDLKPEHQKQALAQMGGPVVKRLTLTLPFGPSVNGMYMNAKKGRVMTKRTKRFYRDVNRIVSEARLCGELPPAPLQGRLKLTYVLYMPDGRRRDIGNYDKAVQDSLVHAGVIADDQQIDELHVYRHYIIPPGKVVVTLESL